ncbi:N-acetylmuramoyl-L-alanine amidase [Macrococcus equipercicus]|uniref:N-acetylmuramoyl-L-alanine amidase n=1 Tax=Macrococcus equipercicus TaxID=69967 RepID=A0A9Q9BS90_9STAP|nr:N-acetylmuramoyl-L-alanine amidase [Macrococcus equipercicus]UTH14779.1 N-acetylmuramoyl-L-alanine amidase [Macrococcus equipercicus]
MKTTKELSDRLDWYIGKYIDPDKKYGFQCADLPTDLVKWATGILMTGNARDLIYNDFKGQADVLINIPELEILKGDILIYSHGRFDNKYGHVAIAYKNITLQSCIVLEQNWDDDADTPVTPRLDYYEGLSHVIRIKFKKDGGITMTKNAKMKYAIITDHTKGLPQIPYRNGVGRPEGVVGHETANPNSTIDGEIAYMRANWQNAFVHAYAGNKKIVEVANTDYVAWGAGPTANGRFIHIELVRYKSKADAMAAIDRWIFYMAYQIYWYNLLADDAADGAGTVWSHDAVSKYLGGTDHSDPIEYLKSWGITWTQVAKKVAEYVNSLYKGDSTKVKAIGENTAQAVQSATKVTAKPTVDKNVSFPLNKYRYRSPEAYVKGRIDSDGAEVRKRTGSQSTGFKFDKKAGYDLQPGDEVYIFETHNGFGRIYTDALTGKGSNDWIWLERLKIDKIFKA